MCLTEPTSWLGGQLTSSLGNGISFLIGSWKLIFIFTVTAIDFGPNNANTSCTVDREEKHVGRGIHYSFIDLPYSFTSLLTWLGWPSNPGRCWVSYMCYEGGYMWIKNIPVSKALLPYSEECLGMDWIRIAEEKEPESVLSDSYQIFSSDSCGNFRSYCNSKRSCMSYYSLLRSSYSIFNLIIRKLALISRRFLIPNKWKIGILLSILLSFRKLSSNSLLPLFQAEIDKRGNLQVKEKEFKEIRIPEL